MKNDSILRDPFVQFLIGITVIICTWMTCASFAPPKPEKKIPLGETMKMFDQNQYAKIYQTCVENKASDCKYSANGGSDVVMQWNGSEWVKVFK